ncbi:hypothetical protein JCM11641_006929 [Rhodosporidiobolus odoratus]
MDNYLPHVWREKWNYAAHARNLLRPMASSSPGTRLYPSSSAPHSLAHRPSKYHPVHRRAVPRNFSLIAQELEQARSRVAQLEAELAALTSSDPLKTATAHVEQHEELADVDEGTTKTTTEGVRQWLLSLREYKRYGRQMMLSQVGLSGQLKLKRAHVLVVGAGGLGCPVLIYLAAAGVGEITIVDHDTVELSNLHRQVLHTEGRVGMSKAESAKVALQALNSDIAVHTLPIAFTPSLFDSSNRSSLPPALVEGTSSLILDCTDNPATRHFINAYAVAHGVPLVSGGAVRAEGTVGAYNVALKSVAEEGTQDRGPCYACLFPPPPSSTGPPTWDTPTESEEERLERERAEDAYYERLSLAGTGACSDEGVLGVLCGVVGIGMATEAMKVLLGNAQPSLHLLSPLSPAPCRTIKTRSRKPTCPACGTFPSSTSSSPASPISAASTPASRWQNFLESPDGEWPGWIDPLCAVPGIGQKASERQDKRIGVEELRKLEKDVAAGEVRVVDTRSAAEFGIASLEGSTNIPFPTLLRSPHLALPPTIPQASSLPYVAPSRLVLLCRRGNDSLLAARAIRRYLAQQRMEERGKKEKGEGEVPLEVEVMDVKGGVTAWAELEKGFPVY